MKIFKASDFMKYTLFLISSIVVVSCISAPQFGSENNDTSPEENDWDQEIPVRKFSLSSANKTKPSNVLEEVVYYPGGAGSPCDGYTGSNLELGALAYHNPYELGTDICSASCGWQPNEQVQIILNRPDKEILEEQTADGVMVYYCYESSFSDPAGRYTIVFKGTSGVIEETVSISPPDGSRLYVHYLESREELHLRYFEPNERIRLFAYGEPGDSSPNASAILSGWQEFTVDSKGQLIIKVDDTTPQYVVLGEESGEVWPFGRSGKAINGMHSSIYVESGGGELRPTSCPGAPSQQLRVGDRAEVCTKYDRLIIRSDPGLGNSEITRLEPGEYVTVIDGPVCADNWSWWKIRMKTGAVGWVAEGGDSVDPYFICPED
jgi:hypothetical protein